MRTDIEIKKMFEEMGLESEKKRSKFNFSYTCSAEQNFEIVTFFRSDTKTNELKEEKNAELE